MQLSLHVNGSNGLKTEGKTMIETLLPVTFTFISLLAISLIFVIGWVGVRRGETLRGDGGDPVLFKRIRVHGNLMENAPAFALILGASEVAGLPSLWLWAAFGSFLLGRVLHFALYDSKLRGGAMVLTTAPGVLMGVWMLTVIWS